MRPGNLTRWTGTFTLAAAAALLAFVPAADSADFGKAASKTSVSSPRPAGLAVAADPPIVFMIQGTDFPGRVAATIGPAGRLTLVSPEGIMAPATPAGECTQDSTTQVSCLPDYVDVITGDLKGGADTFTAGSEVAVLVGNSVPGFESPLLGGPGRDRITGGALSDSVEGGPGADTLIGNDSSDLLKGGPGKDGIQGGLGADALFGGGAPDRLDGGPGRDLCVGGGGIDVADDCFATRRVP